MASTSSSSISSPTSYEYDLFLSFRGEDTRNSFTDHLYKAMYQSGIRTFRDDDEIREGQELKPKIERAITESRASVIVISENFASSRWCLDELWLILEQRRKCGHFVLPVFYKAVPSDVRNQRGNFRIEAKEGSKWTQENVDRWKAALTEVADLKGKVVSGSETAFIEDVVHKIYCELDLKLLSIPTNLAGIEPRARAINTWLKSEQPRSPVLAICGMGGIGKTTLAKYIYNSNKHNFESNSFLEGIENQPSALFGLQKQLLRDLGNNIMISSVSEGALHIVKAIKWKKALIVIDDIDDQDQLSTLFGTKALDTQSKIIITTRHLHIDTLFESISCGCHVHEVELLNHDESLELLSWHAFGSKIPMEDFKELALQLAEYCEGNPLALKVLGSSLPVRAQDQWTRNNMIEMWRSKITSLNSMKGNLDHKIQCVLYKSFESLPCDNHRELFLHIASLFLGEKPFHVEKILEKDWHAKSGITILINRCLVTISRDGLKLTMHKLLEDMASTIVRKESKDPAKRSRVWHKDEAYRLLRKGDGLETIEGLLVNMEAPEQWMTSEAFNTSSLVKMKNLKFLHLDCVNLTGSYENFPDLRYLRWPECYLKTIPPGLLTSCLVALYLEFGDLEEFDPPMVLHSLKILDLSYSSHLVSICNFNQLPKLETLSLQGCISLTHICKTIGDLENLSYLELSGCTKLWKASSNQEFINQQERLKVVFISGGIPEQPFVSFPQSLSLLGFAGILFEMLPSHIGFNMLKALDLSHCPNLKSLPRLPTTLEQLFVNWSSSLERITFQSSRFTLHMFDYEGCFKLCEVEGLFKLVSIAKLDEADLGHMQWIKVYQDHKVDLIGDVIAVDRTFNIQMLYEYGIRSTFLQGIIDQSVAKHEYISLSEFLSFRIPLQPKKNRIQGLNVMMLYRSSFGEEDRNTKPPPLFARISNTTKGITWVYSPVVYCKPRVDEDVIWLSYWPIGNTLDTGDEVHVNILVKEGTLITNGYAVSLVYMDDCEVEKEEKSELMKSEEVIGGDLSLLEVTKGGYYLCRRDFFGSIIPASVFGEIIQITDSRRWRTFAELAIFQEFNDLRNPNRLKVEVELGVNFNSESETDKIKKAVSCVEGVESVSTHKEIGRLIVCGHFDPSTVVKCVREFQKMVQLLSSRLLREQELKKDGLLHHEKENGSEGKIDVESDDEFFDFPDPLFDDESQV